VIFLLLLLGQSLALGFFLGLKRLDTLRLMPLKAGIFIQRDLVGIRGVFVVSNLFVMAFVFGGLA
jgi:hypothetical protein